MKVDNIFDKKCYIMFPYSYTDDNGIYIYEVSVNVNNIKHKTNYTIYTLRIHNCQFDIIIYDDISKGSLEKTHWRKASVFEDDSYINEIGECDVIFAFTKDVILRYYENKLCEISEQLHVRSKELNESMKAIENQKHILYTKPEILFKSI